MDLKQAKDRARAISRTYQVKHTRALEIVARENNFPSWAAFRDAIATPAEAEHVADRYQRSKAKAERTRKFKYKLQDLLAHATNVYVDGYRSSTSRLKSNMRPIDRLAARVVFKPRKIEP